ncbi:type II secretion system F family protein [Streptomyces sp. PTM05]|uniref:Type II secretion system F family protein n=1 Tax=Streptantibioticus parmotrematis TaxID=2873249 RepID=A0ABS7R1R2_9ACTN|nr:type II secretion system F family protein [Streptantibioticus parmotrematis]MBY8888495.1 type II secretion system F family protein [Streptantibioticus parmotrematis]
MGVELVAVWCGVLCAAATVWWLHRQDEAVRRARLMFAEAGAHADVPQAGARWRACRARTLAVLERGRGWAEKRLGTRIGREALCVPTGLVLSVPAHSPVPALAGLLAAVGLGRQLRSRERRLRAEGWRDAIAGLCGAVAGELRAGRPPEVVLAEAVERLRAPGGPDGAHDALTPLLAAARFGGDVPVALRRAAGMPGAEGLAGAAACWEVAADGGSGLADGLDRVAAALRAERDQREDLRAQLAGSKATAAMLALLPGFGLLLGCAMGADPFRVLLRTAAGLGCLLVGGALETAGLVWTARIVRAAEEGT